MILVKKLTSVSLSFSVYCRSWGKLVLVAVKLKLIIHMSCLALLLRRRSSPFLFLSGVQLVPGGPASGETRPAALNLFLSADNGEEHSEGGLVENHVDGNVNMLGGGGGAGRKPLKSGMKELAVFREKVTEQHRQMGKGGKHHLGLEEPKKLRPPPARVREGRVWLRCGRAVKGSVPAGGVGSTTVRFMSSVSAGRVFLIPLLTFNVQAHQDFFEGLSIFGCEMGWTYGFLKSLPSKASTFLLGFIVVV